MIIFGVLMQGVCRIDLSADSKILEEISESREVGRYSLESLVVDLAHVVFGAASTMVIEQTI